MSHKNFFPLKKIYCLHFNECDPKKCTALKLKRLNLVKIVKKIDGKLKKTVILNPLAQKELLINDRERIAKFGITVIDCSWKNITKINLNNYEFKFERKLPPFIAANPVNFGKWGKLSSVEALAAALYLTSFSQEADLLLSKFAWGFKFKELNRL